ncbi:MAG: TorF family putative porin [Pseudomonadales bacterium]|nr:TorF family putative porin [Pseudomonadales bacterium]
MKNFTRNVLGGLIAVSAFAGTQAVAADVSYNIGFASEYYYRGILQKESSASAGVDLETNGFYAGAWTADVGDGLEVDLYGGYGFETETGLTGSIGFTGYYYTGDFDDTYEEINLGLGFGAFSLGYSSGEWDGNGAPADYDFLELGFETEGGLYGTYGSFGKDFDGDYVELGYGTTVSDIDLGVAFIFSDDLGDQADGESQALVFSVGKSF